MTNDELQSEVDRLRAELALRQESDVQHWKERAEKAEHEAEHFRAEANRNAELGRKIAADYQTQLIGLRGQVEAASKQEAYERRFGKK